MPKELILQRTAFLEIAIFVFFCQFDMVFPQKSLSFANGMDFEGAKGLSKRLDIFMEDENFNNELEELLNMLKKLMEKQDLSSIPGIDPEQLEQLKMFMSQFDEIKSDMKFEIYKLDPFTKKIISVIVNEMKDKLGAEVDLTPEQPTAEEIVTKKEKELKDITDTNERYDSLIATIDEQLRNSQLSENEINALLDKRSEILARRNG